jgi:uncharacterized protein
MTFSNPSLQPGDIPQYSSLDLQQVHPAFKKVMLIERGILWLVLSAGASAIIFSRSVNGKPWWILGAAVFLLLLLGVLIFTAGKSFQNLGYALRRHDLVFRKGWLFEKLHIVPLKKIQHCQVRRGPLERKFGLASLKIFTAGGTGADITLGGLTQQEAERLKDWLVISPGETINPISGEDAATLA